MLECLHALTLPREPGSHWVVKTHPTNPRNGKTIVIEKGENHRLINLIDLIRTIQFANSKVCSIHAPLSQKGTEEIFVPLLDAAIKLQMSIDNCSFFKRTIINIVQFILTGTSLFKAINSLKTSVIQEKSVPNTFAARLAYPQLVADAELALKDMDTCKEITKKYKVPDVFSDTKRTCIIKCPEITLLYYVKQAFCTEWKKIRTLLLKGKTIEDPTVMDHCDTAMQMALILSKLALSHELKALYKKNYGKDPVDEKLDLGFFLGNQTKANYSYWSMFIAGQFYRWIRMYPRHNGMKEQYSQWSPSYKEHEPFMHLFYRAGSRPSLWRNIFNEICSVLTTHVDKDAFLGVDDRFYLNEDTGTASINHIDLEMDDRYMLKNNLQNTW